MFSKAYLRGYLVLKLSGRDKERFVNICRKRGMTIFDVWQVQGFYNFCMPIKDFLKIREVVHKTQVKIAIQKRVGLPFVFSTLKKRKMFIGGFLFIVMTMIVLSMFIWRIDVLGDENVDEHKILAKLDELGVKIGTLKSKINTDVLSEKLLVSEKNLVWISSKIQGVKFVINLASRKEPVKIISQNVPCDIVAKSDGYVDNVVVKAGTGRVKVGDTVRKGDILIEGVEIFNENRKKMTHALGNVSARTWYSVKSPVETTYFEKIRTGRIIKQVYIRFNGKKIMLNKPSIENENYDQIEEVNFSLPKNFGLDFGFGVINNYEKISVERVNSYENACNIAREIANEQLTNIIPTEATIIAENENIIKQEDGRSFIEIVVECVEEIGTIKVENYVN